MQTEQLDFDDAAGHCADFIAAPPILHLRKINLGNSQGYMLMCKCARCSFALEVPMAKVHVRRRNRTGDELPRLMTKEDAAAYCRLSISGFARWVSTGKMPGPLPGTRRWDKRVIEDALSRMSSFAPGPAELCPLEKFKAERELKRRSKLKASSQRTSSV